MDSRFRPRPSSGPAPLIALPAGAAGAIPGGADQRASPQLVLQDRYGLRFGPGPDEAVDRADLVESESPVHGLLPLLVAALDEDRLRSLAPRGRHGRPDGRAPQAVTLGQGQRLDLHELGPADADPQEAVGGDLAANQGREGAHP